MFKATLVLGAGHCLTNVYMPTEPVLSVALTITMQAIRAWPGLALMLQIARNPGPNAITSGLEQTGGCSYQGDDLSGEQQMLSPGGALAEKAVFSLQRGTRHTVPQQHTSREGRLLSASA